VSPDFRLTFSKACRTRNERFGSVFRFLDRNPKILAIRRSVSVLWKLSTDPSTNNWSRDYEDVQLANLMVASKFARAYLCLTRPCLDVIVKRRACNGRNRQDSILLYNYIYSYNVSIEKWLSSTNMIYLSLFHVNSYVTFIYYSLSLSLSLSLYIYIYIYIYI